MNLEKLSRDFRVYYSKEFPPGLNGFSYNVSYPTVVVNLNLSLEVRRAILAHEIAHLVLEHPGLNVSQADNHSANECEMDAWEAAGIMLIPSSVIAFCRHHTISEMAQELQVPGSMVAERMGRLEWKMKLG